MNQKYAHFIYFETVTEGIFWGIASRDSKRTVKSGTSENYDKAVVDSEAAFWQAEPQPRL